MIDAKCRLLVFRVQFRLFYLQAALLYKKAACTFSLTFYIDKSK
ncbi:hypothetical protein HMPREF0476_1934 [Kingella kingae ATCC 23330]|uniref:Uncharacterized protein n=1 Tax=Kingella kingae ATCC 23330 TaxID=887327 RepID=F5S9Q1_KINKI|nr:hypothetical protein HMPREF0476_1934 [Kingella kingae ATCC 23330]